MKKTILIIIALVSLGSIANCSKQAIYESMRSKSNDMNAQDPNYNPDNIQDYNEYESQREMYLDDQKDKQKQ